MPELVYEAAGQSIDCFNTLTTVDDIIGRVVRETRAALGALETQFPKEEST